MSKAWKIFVIELFFFAATLLLGVFVTLRIENIFQITEAANGYSDSFSSTAFVAYFLLASFIMYMISKSERFKKGRILFFRFAFYFSVFLGAMITLSTVFYEIFAMLIIIILLIFWSKRPIIALHNLLITLSISGIGAVMGRMFEPLIIAGLLTLFSIYDFIAVYKTKHMVKMATEMIKTKAIMGLVIPFSFSDLSDDLEKKKKKEFMVLGGGDLAFPLFLISSITLTYGLFEGVVMVVFACLGLLSSFLLFVTQKEKKPIPALPPIALLSLIGYLVIALV